MRYSPEQMEQNRQMFLYHIRMNPRGRDFHYGSMSDGCNGRCTLGLGAEAFGIDLGMYVDGFNPEKSFYFSVYDQLDKLLGVRAVSRIWMANDAEVADKGEIKRKFTSFDQMAEEVEQIFANDPVTNYDNRGYETD